MTTTADKPLPTLTDLPQPPADAVFKLLRVEKITMPHPYCIGPEHVVHASDNFGGSLTKECIEDLERKCKHGCCEVPGCNLRLSDHETSVTLFIEIPDNRIDLNTVPGLKEYLCAHKATMESAGIQGFAFPDRRRRS